MHEYARQLRAELPPEIFQRRPVRLAWLAVHLTVIVTLAVLVLYLNLPWWLAVPFGLLAGHSWGCITFLAHETMHHAVVGSRLVENIVGYIGLLPYCTSPTFWVAWHNQTHHAYTGHVMGDTDHFGTLHLWERTPYLKVMESIAPGSGTTASWFYLPTHFAVVAWVVLLKQSMRRGFYKRISLRRVCCETGSMICIWLLLLLCLGPVHFAYLVVVPALAANTLVMSYIATNHYLTPLTSANDPLVNTVSVRAPAFIESIHLQFGYHVEHHIFPTMSAINAPIVRKAIRRLYGDRYLSLRHVEALRLIYTRPKLHSDATTLVDPRTGLTYKALGRGSLDMPVINGQSRVV